MLKKALLKIALVSFVSTSAIAGPFSHDGVKFIYATGDGDDLDVKGIAVESEKSINQSRCVRRFLLWL